MLLTARGSNGWGASAIDALSTALIMGKTDVVSQILDFVPEIDFSVSYNDTVVSLFETTIRYLGGLLSGKTPPGGGDTLPRYPSRYVGRRVWR